MIFDEFILDPDGHCKDWLNLLVTQGDKDDLARCAKVLGKDINSIRQWGYRSKDNDHAYLYRAVVLSVCMRDDRIVRHWAQMFREEVHPAGTGVELERLKKLEADMKAVLGEGQ